jgi:hypothetical protein
MSQRDYYEKRDGWTIEYYCEHCDLPSEPTGCWRGCPPGTLYLCLTICGDLDNLLNDQERIDAEQ